MTHITCRLTAKNWDQLGNSTLGNRVWATFLMYVLRWSSQGAVVKWMPWLATADASCEPAACRSHRVACGLITKNVIRYSIQSPFRLCDSDLGQRADGWPPGGALCGVIRAIHLQISVARDHFLAGVMMSPRDRYIRWSAAEHRCAPWNTLVDCRDPRTRGPIYKMSYDLS